MNAPALNELPTGFRSPARDSQYCFRQLMTAMSFPGRLMPIEVADFSGPATLAPASAALLTALPDAQSTVFLSASLQQQALITAFVSFHTGATPSDCKSPCHADLAWVCQADNQKFSLDQFNAGSDLKPHLSTTLFVEVAGLSTTALATPGANGPESAISLNLSGPGIASRTPLTVRGLGPDFWQDRIALQRHFPRGIDLVLISDKHIAALPRTTQLEVS